MKKTLKRYFLLILFIFGVQLTLTYFHSQAQDNGLPPDFVMSSIAWSPDGTRLVSGYYGGFVRIIDIATGATLFELPSGSQPVYVVAWNSVGDKIARANYNGTIQVRVASTGHLLQEMTSDLGAVSGLLWGHDSQHIISSAGERGILQVWGITSGALIDQHPDGSLGQMVWSPDGTRLLSATGAAAVISDAATYDVISLFEMPERGVISANGGDVISVTWHPDGNIVASGSLNGQVRLWNVETGEMLDEFRGNYAPVTGSFETAVRSVQFSPDGTQLISVSADGTIRIWDIETGRVVDDFQTDTRISAAAWSADGCQLAYGKNTSHLPDAGEYLYDIITFCEP
jgi:WD40 repeat protein